MSNTESRPDPCVCLAMLVADKVFREEGTGKSHIAGTFSRMRARHFPVMREALHVYLALTDIAPGAHSCEVKFSYLDSDQEILSATCQIISEDKLQVCEINYCLRRAVFPRPGQMEIAFHMDGQYVTRRKFVLELAQPRDVPPAGEA